MAVVVSVVLVLYGLAGLFELATPSVDPAVVALLLGSALTGLLAAFVQRHGRVVV